MVNREQISKASLELLMSVDDGYKCIDGVVYHNGDIVECRISKEGYKFYFFKIGTLNKRVFLHRLVAYQLYGEKLFDEGVVVRHLDNDKLNNMDSNIGLGLAKDNLKW